MEQVKIILYILSFISAISILILMNVNIPQLKLKKSKTIVLIFAVMILVLTFFIKDVPILKEGDCFVIENYKESNSGEEWNSQKTSSLAEFQVLKIGKKHYLVHSSVLWTGDYPIYKDYNLTKSDCRILFKRE